MIDVYSECPVIENEVYHLRLVSHEDADDLLAVYQDEEVIPIFNSDNCNGMFRCRSLVRMEGWIESWLNEYARRGFVRWTVLDKRSCRAIGTIELFHRIASDDYNNSGLLRLDLRSEYEVASEIEMILSLILEPSFEWFNCSMIATKAIDMAKERRVALNALGFVACDAPLIGHDGTKYYDYFVFEKP